MSFNEANVSIVRLVNGEDVIGVVELAPGQKTKLKLPFSVRIVEGANGKLNVNMAPYLPLLSEDEDIEFPEGLVAFKYIPNKDVVAKYKSIYLKLTSNIILPTNGSVNSQIIKP